MKLIIEDETITIEYVNKDIEKKNVDFLKGEYEGQKKFSKTETDQEKIKEIFEPIGVLESSLERKVFPHKFYKTTVNDKELGDLISIECEVGQEMSIDLIPFNYKGVNILSGRELYIHTELNHELLEARKK